MTIVFYCISLYQIFLVKIASIGGGEGCVFRCSKSLCYKVVHPSCIQMLLLFKVETWVWEYHEGPDETDAQGLHTKTVGLHFQVQDRHFTDSRGSGTPTMEIRCICMVGGSTREKVVYSTLAKPLASNKLAHEGFRNSASKILLPTTTV